MTTFSRARMLAAGAALALAPRSALAQASAKIQVCATPADDLTPLLYGIHSGLYQGAGLDVEYVPTASGSAATAAVVSGTYQIGTGSFLSSLLAYEQGVPLAVIANGGLWDPKFPFAQILVAADSPLKSAADFNGKVAGSPSLNDLNELAVSAWMDKNGGDFKSLKWIEIPNAAAADALGAHRIDVYVLNEPQMGAALAGGKVRSIAPAYTAIAPRFVFQLYFANLDWAQQNGPALRRWVQATYRAAAYTNAHEGATAPMMADVTKIPLATVRSMIRVPAATATDPHSLQPAIDAAAHYKSIPRAFRAEQMYLEV